jgi:hypothetical protein
MGLGLAGVPGSASPRAYATNKAEAYARARRWTMSGLLMEALERYMAEIGDAEDPARRRSPEK